MKNYKKIFIFSILFSAIFHLYFLLNFKFMPFSSNNFRNKSKPISLVDLSIDYSNNFMNNKPEDKKTKIHSKRSSKSLDKSNFLKLPKKNNLLKKEKTLLLKDKTKNYQNELKRNNNLGSKSLSANENTFSDSIKISSNSIGTNNNKKIFLPFYKVDKLPEFIKKAKLEYPEEALEANVEGVVILDVYIDEKGNVVGIKVISTPGFRLEGAAIKMIRDSRFSPAYVNGKPVCVIMRFIIRFRLE